MNLQREVIYAERRKVLEGEDLREHYLGMIEEVMDELTSGYSQNEEESFKLLKESVRKLFPVSLEGLETALSSPGELNETLIAKAKAAYDLKEKEIGPEFMRVLERMILLDVVDSKWKDHLRSMDNLREGIGLRAYGQKDPLVEYKHDAYVAFQEMIQTIKEDAIAFIFRVQPAAERIHAAPVVKKPAPLQFLHPEATSGYERPQSTLVRGISPGGAGEFMEAPPPAAPSQAHVDGKVGRNDPCPCGSGKKYKKCHGA